VSDESWYGTVPVPLLTEVFLRQVSWGFHVDEEKLPVCSTNTVYHSDNNDTVSLKLLLHCLYDMLSLTSAALPAGSDPWVRRRGRRAPAARARFTPAAAASVAQTTRIIYYV
jgi:hypothetical protein